MDKLLKKFLENTYSVTQARNRLMLLRNLLQKKYYNSSNVFKGPTPSEKEWIESLGDEFFSSFNQSNIDQALLELQKAVGELDKIMISIAFEIPEDEVEKLGIWVRQNFKTRVILDFKYDLSLIAGCALFWKGNFRDFSVRSNIDKNRAQVLSTLTKFVR